MKTIPLDEAIDLSAPVIRATQSGLESQNSEPITMTINGRPLGQNTTALLAHFYNHGPELVRVLDDLVAAQIDPMGIKAANVCKEAVALLAKASTVQMP